MTILLTWAVVGAVAVLMLVSGVRTALGTAREGLVGLRARMNGDL